MGPGDVTDDDVRDGPVLCWAAGCPTQALVGVQDGRDETKWYELCEKHADLLGFHGFALKPPTERRALR